MTPSRDPLWRELNGIERDLEDIIPWLNERATIRGGPADRAIMYLRRLLELVRERGPK